MGYGPSVEDLTDVRRGIIGTDDWIGLIFRVLLDKYVTAFCKI